MLYSARPYERATAPAGDASLRLYYDAELRKVQNALTDLRQGLCLTQATYLVANLPAANSVSVGSRAFVTDANATTFNSIVAGGGSNKLPVFSDGTNWRIG